MPATSFSWRKFLVFAFPIFLLVLDFGGAVGWCDNCSGSWIMHFLGGVAIALIGLYAVFHSRFFSPAKDHWLLIFFLLVGVASLAGILWETYEFVLDNFLTGVLDYPTQPGLKDTMFDLFFDMFGGIAVALGYLIWNIFGSKRQPLE